MKQKIKTKLKSTLNILVEASRLSKRELWSIFSNLQTYIVIGLFLVILTILSFVFGKLSEFGTSDLSQFYTYVVGGFVVIIPALTMGFIAREREKGTIEAILTQPIHESSYVVSKLLSASFLVLVLLLTTIPFVLTTLLFSSDADVGQIIMQFVSPYLVGVSFAAIGICFSAIFSSEITAFVASLVTSVALFLVGTGLLDFTPEFLKSFTERFSILNHFQSLSRGVLDFRDLVFFFCLIIIFVLTTFYFILKIKYPRGDKKLNKIWLANIALVLFFIAFAYIGNLFNIRIDLTSNQKYTISQETKKVIDSIDSELKIDFFESANLPTELSAQTKTVRDLLIDLEYTSGNINYDSLDPISDTSLESKLTEYAIQPLQLRVNRDNSSEVVLAYYSLGISYGEKKDKIDLSVTGIEDLEFQLAKKIKNIVGKNKVKVGVVNNNVENYLTQNLTTFNAQLTELYEVEEFSLNKDSDLSKFAGIFIPSANASFDDEVNQKLIDYFNNGGGIFVTTENVLIDENSLPKSNSTNLNDFLEQLGIEINKDFVYDLKDNNIIALSSDFYPVVINFPLWIISSSVNSENEITKDISSVSLLWANSIEVNQDKISELGLSYTQLFATSPLSNVQKETEWNISPDQEFTQKNDDKNLTVGASLINSNDGRIVVISDGQFLTDDILQALAQRNAQDVNSLSLGINSLSWVTKDDLLGGIKSKVKTAQKLNLLEYQKVILVTSVNVIPMAALLVVYFVVKRRRNQIVL